MSEQLYQNVGEKFIPEKEGSKSDSSWLRRLREPDSSCIRRQEEKKLAELFGVSNSYFGQVFQGKYKSKPFTKEEIAQVLLDNGLVEDKREGLRETEILLQYGIGEALLEYNDSIWKFLKVNDKGKEKFQLTYGIRTWKKSSD
jgi:hypothetical protein